MKSAIYLLTFISFSLTLSSQTLQPSTFVSSASTDVQGNTQLSWVLGEVFTGAFGAGDSQLSQGSAPSDSILTHSRLIALPAIRIFPNPTQSRLRITGIKRPGTWSGRVFTLLGAKVLEQELSAYGSNELSLQHLPIGTYILILSSDAGEYFPTQFIKE